MAFGFESELFLRVDLLQMYFLWLKCFRIQITITNNNFYLFFPNNIFKGMCYFNIIYYCLNSFHSSFAEWQAATSRKFLDENFRWFENISRVRRSNVDRRRRPQTPTTVARLRRPPTSTKTSPTTNSTPRATGANPFPPCWRISSSEPIKNTTISSALSSSRNPDLTGQPHRSKKFLRPSDNGTCPIVGPCRSSRSPPPPTASNFRQKADPKTKKISFRFLLSKKLRPFLLGLRPGLLRTGRPCLRSREFFRNLFETKKLNSKRKERNKFETKR